MAYNPNYRKAQPSRQPRQNAAVAPKHNERNAAGVPVNIAENTDESIINIALLLKNNSAIKRYTALGIINLLRKNGKISDTDKCYINFKWNKFSINVNGKISEFYYTDPVAVDGLDFLRCFIAAFKSLQHNAQHVINEFCVSQYNEPSTEINITNEQTDEIATETLKNNNVDVVEE